MLTPRPRTIFFSLGLLLVLLGMYGMFQSLQPTEDRDNAKASLNEFRKFKTERKEFLHALDWYCDPKIDSNRKELKKNDVGSLDEEKLTKFKWLEAIVTRHSDGAHSWWWYVILSLSGTGILLSLWNFKKFGAKKAYGIIFFMIIILGLLILPYVREMIIRFFAKLYYIDLNHNYLLVCAFALLILLPCSSKLTRFSRICLFGISFIIIYIFYEVSRRAILNPDGVQTDSFLLIGVGGAVILLSILWHINTISKDWMTAVGFTFKGLGALLLLLFGQLFHSYQVKIADSKEVQIAASFKEQAIQQQYAENVKSLRLLIEDYTRDENKDQRSFLLNAMAVTLQDQTQQTLNSLQFYYTIARAGNKGEKDVARALVFPKLDSKGWDELKGIPLYTDAFFYLVNKGKLALFESNEKLRWNTIVNRLGEENEKVRKARRFHQTVRFEVVNKVLKEDKENIKLSDQEFNYLSWVVFDLNIMNRTNDNEYQIDAVDYESKIKIKNDNQEILTAKDLVYLAASKNDPESKDYKGLENKLFNINENKNLDEVTQNTNKEIVPAGGSKVSDVIVKGINETDAVSKGEADLFKAKVAANIIEDDDLIRSVYMNIPYDDDDDELKLNSEEKQKLLSLLEIKFREILSEKSKKSTISDVKVRLRFYDRNSADTLVVYYWLKEFEEAHQKLKSTADSIFKLLAGNNIKNNDNQGETTGLLGSNNNSSGRDIYAYTPSDSLIVSTAGNIYYQFDVRMGVKFKLHKSIANQLLDEHINKDLKIRSFIKKFAEEKKSEIK